MSSFGAGIILVTIPLWKTTCLFLLIASYLEIAESDIIHFSV